MFLGFQDIGELFDRELLGQVAEIDFSPERLLDSQRHLHGAQRVAAELEELIPNSEALGLENLLPNVHELSLQVIPWRDEAPIHGRQRGVRELHSIDLAAARQRQSVMRDERRRHHVNGHLFLKGRAQ